MFEQDVTFGGNMYHIFYVVILMIYKSPSPLEGR